MTSNVSVLFRVTIIPCHIPSRGRVGLLFLLRLSTDNCFPVISHGGLVQRITASHWSAAEFFPHPTPNPTPPLTYSPSDHTHTHTIVTQTPDRPQTSAHIFSIWSNICVKTQPFTMVRLPALLWVTYSKVVTFVIHIHCHTNVVTIVKHVQRQSLCRDTHQECRNNDHLMNIRYQYSTQLFIFSWE